MTDNPKRTLLIAAGLIASCGLLLLATALWVGTRLAAPASAPTLDLLATLQAATPLTVYPAASPAPMATSAFNFPTGALTASAVPSGSSSDGPIGKIVFTCQVYKVQASNQICIINADGSGFRRLTTDDSRQHYYPSLSPDGNSVVYAAFREENVYEIYEMDLATGVVTQLTRKLGVLNAPEISPDGQYITFMRWKPNSDKYQIMVMERDGENPNNIPKITGWDPTWSPNGKSILFASDMKGSTQLYVVKENGSGLYQVQ